MKFTIPNFEELVPPNRFAPPEPATVWKDEKLVEWRVPDPEKIVPPAPNLDGDDVMFARYHPETGEVINIGHMHRDHFKAEQEAGVHIIEHGEHAATLGSHRVHLERKALVPHQPKPDPQAAERKALGAARDAVALLLDQSDKYFVSDALENISQAEQDEWKAWRKQLRDANKKPDARAILAAVPPDPKGLDRVGPIRPKGKP